MVRLRNLRKLAGLTQSEIVELMAKAGITTHQTSIMRYEQKSSALPPRQVLLWYAEYFQVTLDYIFERDNDDVPHLSNTVIDYLAAKRAKEQLFKDLFTKGTKSHEEFSTTLKKMFKEFLRKEIPNLEEEVFLREETPSLEEKASKQLEPFIEERLHGQSLNAIHESMVGRSNNTSGVRGVAYNKVAEAWQVEIMFKKVRHSLGYYEDISDAIDVRALAGKLFNKIYHEEGRIPDKSDSAKFREEQYMRLYKGPHTSRCVRKSRRASSPGLWYSKKDKKWRAVLSYMGVRHALGQYASEDLAKEMYALGSLYLKDIYEKEERIPTSADSAKFRAEQYRQIYKLKT